MAFWIISARDHTPKGSQMKTCDRTLMLRGSTTTHENRIDKATACGPKNILSISMATRPCCMNGREDAVVPCPPFSADRLGLRTTQFLHPVEQLASQ